MSNRQGGIDAVVLRNEFQGKGFSALLKVTVWQSIAIIALVAALATVCIMKRDRILAQTSDGRLIEPTTLEKPIYTDDWVLQWAGTSTRHIMTFGFNDRKMRWQDDEIYFTKEGYESFLKADAKAHLSQIVDSRQLVMQSVLDDTPTVVGYGEYKGQYYWQLQMPVLASYEGGGQHKPYHYLVELIVMQVPLTEKPNGLAIFAFNVKERNV